jgi:PHP family Zn ribbon phosphoesterase
MTNFICTTCGTQHAEADEPPAACAICQGVVVHLGVSDRISPLHDVSLFSVIRLPL